MKIIFFILGFILPIYLFSQQDTVDFSGIVVDGSGNPVPFTQVTIVEAENSLSSCYADIDGLFSLRFSSIQETFRVRINFIGYQQEEILIRKDTLEDRRYLFCFCNRVQFTPDEINKVYISAYRYIKKGKAVILTVRTNDLNDKVSKKYGFRYKYIVLDYVYADCTERKINPRQLAYMNLFNSFMFSYLEKRNGAGWQEQYKKDCEKQKEQIDARDRYWKIYNK